MKSNRPARRWQLRMILAISAPKSAEEVNEREYEQSHTGHSQYRSQPQSHGPVTHATAAASGYPTRQRSLQQAEGEHEANNIKPSGARNHRQLAIISQIVGRKGFSLCRNQARHGDFRVALKCSIAQFWCRSSALPSDCLPDVRQQIFVIVAVASDCPRTVRILERCEHGS
jgi:hypothetical protein